MVLRRILPELDWHHGGLSGLRDLPPASSYRILDSLGGGALVDVALAWRADRRQVLALKILTADAVPALTFQLP